MKRAFVLAVLAVCLAGVVLSATACGGAAELSEKLSAYNGYAEQLSSETDEEGRMLYCYRTADEYAIEFTVTAYFDTQRNTFGDSVFPSWHITDDLRDRINGYVAAKTVPFELSDENILETAEEVLEVCFEASHLLQKYDAGDPASCVKLPLTIVTESGTHTVTFRSHEQADIDEVVGRLYRVLHDDVTPT